MLPRRSAARCTCASRCRTAAPGRSRTPWRALLPSRPPLRAPRRAWRAAALQQRPSSCWCQSTGYRNAAAVERPGSAAGPMGCCDVRVGGRARRWHGRRERPAFHTRRLHGSGGRWSDAPGRAPGLSGGGRAGAHPVPGAREREDGHPHAARVLPEPRGGHLPRAAARARPGPPACMPRRPPRPYPIAFSPVMRARTETQALGGLLGWPARVQAVSIEVKSMCCAPRLCRRVDDACICRRAGRETSR